MDSDNPELGVQDQPRYPSSNSSSSSSNSSSSSSNSSSSLASSSLSSSSSHSLATQGKSQTSLTLNSFRSRPDFFKQTSLDLQVTSSSDDDDLSQNKGLQSDEKHQRLLMVKQMSSLYILGKSSKQRSLTLMTPSSEALPSTLSSLSVSKHLDENHTSQDTSDYPENESKTDNVKTTDGLEIPSLSLPSSKPEVIVDGIPNEDEERNGNMDTKPDSEGDMNTAISLFNQSPEKGVDYLIKHSLVVNSPAELATFLAGTASLNKIALGEFLGEKSSAEILKHFVEKLNFNGLDFDIALRHFLLLFKLPGESQKIDRILEAFAKRYCSCNLEDTVFENPDVAFVLAFSLIMLNTDAHNPSIKSKMTKAQFLSNTRGINKGKDLPKEYLEDMYNCIVDDEIKLKPGEDVSLLKSVGIKRDWLHLEKRTRLLRSVWKKRWFVLESNHLYCYKLSTSGTARYIFPLDDLTLIRHYEESSKSARKHTLLLEIVLSETTGWTSPSPSPSFQNVSSKSFSLDLNNQTPADKIGYLHLSASSSYSYKSWVRCLKKLVRIKSNLSSSPSANTNLGKIHLSYSPLSLSSSSTPLAQASLTDSTNSSNNHLSVSSPQHTGSSSLPTSPRNNSSPVKTTPDSPQLTISTSESNVNAVSNLAGTPSKLI